MLRKENTYNGVLLVNKPAGITSHDLVHEIRKIVKQKKVGHTGTLDQKADGLMAICLGKATKVARFITDFGKTYEAEIRLGIQSETYDAEGVVDGQKANDIPHLDNEKIDKLLSEFRGHIMQTVPAYSAVRVNGNRLYNLARQGKQVDPPEREVHIKEIVLLQYEEPYLRIRVSCSKGTYIRSIAHEIGVKLGCGAYLSNLTRSSIGELDIKDALTLEQIERQHKDNNLGGFFVPFNKLFKFGSFVVNDDFRQAVLNGKAPTKNNLEKIDGSFDIGDRVALKDTAGNIIAIGTSEIFSSEVENTEDYQKLFKYSRVLN